MTAISDPIGNGLVASFARPGGNTTGVTLFSNELAGKRLEMLKEVVPQLTRVAILAEQDRPPTATLVSETQVAAHTLRLALQIFEARPAEIAEAFRLMGKERPDALIVQQNLSFTPHLRQIAELAITSHRLPTVHPTGNSSRPAGSWPTDRAYSLWVSALPGTSTGFQGDETGRSSGRATDQVQVDTEPEDREGTWPRRVTLTARHRR